MQPVLHPGYDIQNEKNKPKQAYKISDWLTAGDVPFHLKYSFDYSNHPMIPLLLSLHQYNAL